MDNKKEVLTYVKEGVKIRKGDTEAPCLLFVTAVYASYGVKITVRGLQNPFPFTEAIIPKGNLRIDLGKWLLAQGYKEIGRYLEYLEYK